MKTSHSKLKAPPRPLFSCAFFRNCTTTQPSLSPTTPTSRPLPISPSHHAQLPPLPPPPPPPLLPPPPPPAAAATKPSSSSSSSPSSSTSTSQSFTQWKFPLSTSPLCPSPTPPPRPPPPPPPISSATLQEVFHLAELQLSPGSPDPDRLSALHLLERSLVPNPPTEPSSCPPELLLRILNCMRTKLGVKPAVKILFALCLAGDNRRVAVEVGAVGAVVELAMELDGPSAERALAALELMCTVAEGAAEIRAHALAVPVMVAMIARMEGRGREHPISVLAVIFSGGEVTAAAVAPPKEVARAVVLALQGDCSARCKRKGAQLLRLLQESENGRLDLSQEGG